MIKNSDSGYILSSVLHTGFLIISLLFGVFVVVLFNFKLDIKRFNKKRMELACWSAVQKHIATHAKEISSGFYLLPMDSCNVKLSYEMKGLFYLVTAETKKYQDSAKVLFLLNRAMNPEFENALILSRPNITPSVAGETKITGDILMSNNHIARGTVYGIKNSSDNFLSGTIKQNPAIKVKLFQDTLVRRIFGMTPDSSFYRYDGSLSLSASDLDTLHNVYVTGNVSISGQEAARRFYSIPSVSSLTSVSSVPSVVAKVIAHGKLVISDGTILHREIEIHCDSTAEIGRNTKLENLMIAAGNSITVAPDSRFQSVQLFSQRGIDCDRAVFNYPSVLCSWVDTAKGSYKNEINLRSSVVNGSVMLVSTVTGLSSNLSKIVIDEKSSVQGIVYSENNAEIHGRVLGSVYVFNLWYYQKPTEYQNWLINLNIDRTKLNPAFLLPVGLGEGSKYKTVAVTWVY